MITQHHNPVRIIILNPTDKI